MMHGFRELLSTKFKLQTPPPGCIECTGFAVVVGLSVDYALHLTHCIQEGASVGLQSRELRMRYGLTAIGGTIVAASVTTMACGLCMLWGLTSFVFKFGILIIITIVYSFLYTFGLFVSLMLLVGPQDQVGPSGSREGRLESDNIIQKTQSIWI